MWRTEIRFFSCDILFLNYNCCYFDNFLDCLASLSDSLSNLTCVARGSDVHAALRLLWRHHRLARPPTGSSRDFYTCTPTVARYLAIVDISLFFFPSFILRRKCLIHELNWISSCRSESKSSKWSELLHQSPPPENVINSQGFVACFCKYCIHSSIRGSGSGALPPVECFY